MDFLAAHALAFRALGMTLGEEASDATGPNRDLLKALSGACSQAATDLEAQIPTLPMEGAATAVPKPAPKGDKTMSTNPNDKPTNPSNPAPPSNPNDKPQPTSPAA